MVLLALQRLLEVQHDWDLVDSWVLCPPSNGSIEMKFYAVFVEVV